MKMLTILISIIVIVAVVVVAIFGYQQVQQREALRDIQISISDVKIESVNLSSASLNFTLRITNPSTNVATLDRTEYTIFINNVSLGTGQNQGKVTIPAGGTVFIPQPFIASNRGVAQGAWAFLTQDQVSWRIVGTAFFDTFLGTVSVGYDFSGTTAGVRSTPQ
ncbi:MAG: LEA type 2 family protein [Methanomassiliicoccales archaeon]|nr:LEA type 2 family protein [Methanomassiliicoccales archaeon]